MADSDGLDHPLMIQEIDILLETAAEFWELIAGALHLAVAIVATGHVVLHKRDPSSAIGWAGLIWLVPFAGSLLYGVLGVNRIVRLAVKLRGDDLISEHPDDRFVATRDERERLLGSDSDSLLPLPGAIDSATRRPLLTSNCVEPLDGGPVTYDAMLAAIEQAEHSVALATYIFNHDEIGRKFVAALGRARARGVEVRVLVDAVGMRYSKESIEGSMAEAGVRFARFMPSRSPLMLPYANLRNHRKILVIDGHVGFTGGMNIQEACVYAPERRHAVRDLHFRIEGPVVSHLAEVFAEDWAFTTGEKLEGELWYSPLVEAGPMLARGIPDGPDEDHDKMRLTLLAALSCARRSVRIITPYFLPNPSLVMALGMCARRGVEVDILLPKRSNLRVVQWASTAMLWQVLEHGCHVWLSPPPFDHTKLMVVDGTWTLLGSANWDPRSLRLNFELGVECYDRDLATGCEDLFERRRANASAATLEQVDARPLPVRLRDGVARLFMPYL